MSCRANKCIACTVEQCAYHCGNDNFCSLDRILVRQSGTEPLIRVMVEAETGEICEELVDGVISVIRSKGYGD